MASQPDGDWQDPAWVALLEVRLPDPAQGDGADRERRGLAWEG